LKTNYKPKIRDGLKEGFVAKDEKNERNGKKDMGKDTTSKRLQSSSVQQTAHTFRFSYAATILTTWTGSIEPVHTLARI
jgi:hypothetical protein